MGIVIGYKGSQAERHTNWTSMLMLKESIKEFSTQTTVHEKKIFDNDNECYSEFLSNYVRKVA